MTAFHTRELNLYRFSAFALGMLILGVSALGSLSLVWMRQQITHTAASTVVVERDVHDVDRENARLGAQIARAHQPELLLARASSDLRPTASAQVVWMPATGAFPDHFVAENRERAHAVVSESPLSISFDLALLNARSRSEQH